MTNKATTNYFIHSSASFEQGLTASKTGQANLWRFVCYSFDNNDRKALRKIKGGSLEFIHPTLKKNMLVATDASPIINVLLELRDQRVARRHHQLSSFVWQQDTLQVCLSPSSRTDSSKLYFVIALELDRKLGKALKYAAKLERLSSHIMTRILQGMGLLTLSHKIWRK